MGGIGMQHYSMRVLIVILLMLAFCASAQAKDVPYTVELDAAAKIYQGHGVDYGYSRQVGEDGIYTIVEEAYDRSGNLWGRLKSGAGWVMLEEKKQIVVSEVQYTTALRAADDICAGPGYSYGYLRDVGEDGVYTIVQEAVGDDGFLWGSLKSGAGWVRLRDVPEVIPPASIDGAYILALDAWVPICNYPSEGDGVCIDIIGEDGVYTIVNEVTDELGNVWGELKSGAGWVNLSYVREMGHLPVTAYFADVIEEIDDSWCDYIADESEYMVRIAFRANERLNNIMFSTLQYDDAYETAENHYWIQWLEEDSYFVVGVVFYGDMTTYGISFVDECGEERHYAVSLSGMNGSVVMNEYVR